MAAKCHGLYLLVRTSRQCVNKTVYGVCFFKKMTKMIICFVVFYILAVKLKKCEEI